MQISDLKDVAPFLAGAIGAAATLFAVVVTSLFNIRVAKINIEAQSRQKSKEMKLQKIEELFFLFDKWQINFSNIYFLHFRCYKKKITYMHVLESADALDLLAPGEAQKYMMIMDLHYPLLKEAYAPVEMARRKIVPFLSDPETNNLDVKDFVTCQQIFEIACVNFKSKISTVAHEILC